MRWHRVAVGAAALAVLLIGMVMPASTQAAPAAAPATTVAQVTFSAPSEGTKVVLPETSIDGPAYYAIPSSGAPFKALIAWTGTDSLHRLNFMTSTDGIHFTNKHTLNETSLWRPAISLAYGRNAGTIVLAWTGTDPAHTLNVMYIDSLTFKTLAKVTYWGETSFTAPGVATYGGAQQTNVALAWAGTDAGHTVNVMRISPTPNEAASKTTLWGWSTISRPDLNWNRDQGQMLLSWTGTNHRIYFATSTDVTAFTMPATSPIAEYSNWAPSMLGLGTTDMPDRWLSWTGTDAAHSVNVRYTTTFPSWPATGAKAVLDEQAISGPELGYIGNLGQVLVSWTGVDAAHHLNVAVINVTSSAGYQVQVYFSKHPQSDSNPTAVFPVTRISPDLGVATYAIKQLLAGPTAAEQQAGYYTEFVGALTGTSTCNGADFTITLNMRGTTPEPGTATLKFCRTVLIPGDLSGPRMVAEAVATLKQFPTITDAVVLTKDGNCLGDLSGLNQCLQP